MCGLGHHGNEGACDVYCVVVLCSRLELPLVVELVVLKALVVADQLGETKLWVLLLDDGGLAVRLLPVGDTTATQVTKFGHGNSL